MDHGLFSSPGLRHRANSAPPPWQSSQCLPPSWASPEWQNSAMGRTPHEEDYEDLVTLRQHLEKRLPRQIVHPVNQNHGDLNADGLEGASGCLMYGLICASRFLHDESWRVSDWVCPDRARSVVDSLLITGAAMTGTWHREGTTKLQQRLGDNNIDENLRPEEVAYQLMEGLLCTTGSTTQTDKFSVLRDFLSRVTVKDYVTERVVSLERSCQILDEHACSTRQVGVLVISYNDPSWPLHLCWHFVACQTHSFLFVSMLHRVGMRSSSDAITTKCQLQLWLPPWRMVSQNRAACRPLGTPSQPGTSNMCDSFWCVLARAIFIWGLAVSPCREFVGRSSFRIVVIVVMGCSFRLVVISQ